MNKKYGMINFLWDATMCCLTGGLWLIRIYCRESRNNA